jgi:ELMO domain-containing protein
LVAYGEQPESKDLMTERWTEIGFQGKNPRTDFRAGGFLSLQCLLYFAVTQPNYFKVQVNRIKEHEDWFLAISCINITSYMMSYLHIKQGNAPAA